MRTHFGPEDDDEACEKLNGKKVNDKDYMKNGLLQQIKEK